MQIIFLGLIVIKMVLSTIVSLYNITGQTDATIISTR
jgi:hypothetical protein